MATWDFRSASPTRRWILIAALMLARCSGSSSSGGSIEPPPPPPPLDPSKFQVALGGAGTELPSFVAATERGGALIVATTDSFGADGVDVWLVETDEVGTILRQRTWGGPGADTPTSVDRTTDGGVVLGVTHGEGSDAAAEVVNLDAEWDEAWRVPRSHPVVRALADGDVAVATWNPDPTTSSTPTLERLAPDGTDRWRVPLDDWPHSYPSAVAEGPDGDLYGSSGSPLVVSRISGGGERRWTTSVDPVEESVPLTALTLVVKDDGSVVAGGYASKYVPRYTSRIPLFAVVSADGREWGARYLDGTQSMRIVAALAEAGGELALLGESSLARVTSDGTVLHDLPLPFAAAAFAPAPGGRFIVGSTEDHGRGLDDVLLAKLDASDQLGEPPAPGAIPPASTFGAVEPIADLGENSAPLSLRASSDASSAPLVAWWPDPYADGQAPLDSARRTSKGRWDSLPLAPAGEGGQLVGLSAAGSGRALAIWLGGQFFGPLLASDLDSRAGWDVTPIRLDPDLGNLTRAYLAGLAANTHGQAVALWEQSASGTGVLAARRFDAGTRSWSAPAVLPGTATTTTLLGDVAIDAAGQALVVRGGAREVSALRGASDGTWRNLGTVATEADSLRSLAVASNGGADVLATWTVYNDTGTGLRTVWLRDGRPLAPPATLNEIRTLTTEPILTSIAPDGRALLVWIDGYTVKASESTPGGAWSTPVPHPDQAAQGANLSGVAALGHGEFLVSWFERRGSRGTAWASRYHTGGTWEAAEFLGDALGGYVTQAGSTVVWLAPTNPGTALVARTAR